jgi:hypothetical protein
MTDIVYVYVDMQDSDDILVWLLYRTQDSGKDDTLALPTGT